MPAKENYKTNQANSLTHNTIMTGKEQILLPYMYQDGNPNNWLALIFHHPLIYKLKITEGLLFKVSVNWSNNKMRLMVVIN